MNDVMFLGGEEFAVKINGEKLPLVESVSEECAVELLPIRAFGEGGVQEYIEKDRRYTLRITRLPGAALPELFTLTVEDGEKTVCYSGCRCAGREKLVRADGTIGEVVTVSAAQREEIT